MTVGSETTISGPYTFNGVTVTFPYAFRILDDDELIVVSINTTTKVLSVVSSSLYSVTGVGEANGGNVVYAVAPSSGATGYALRDCDFTQLVNLTDASFFASSVMIAMDRAAMRLQQLKEVSERSLRGRPGETYGYLPAKVDLKGKVLGFDPITGETIAVDAVEDLISGEASAAEIWNNTAGKIITTDAAWSAADPVTIAFASSLTLDFSTFINAKVVLNNSCTLQTPTNLKKGQSGCIELIQNGDSAASVNFSNAAFVWGDGVEGQVSQGVGDRSLLFYQILDDEKVYCSLVRDVS